MIEATFLLDRVRRSRFVSPERARRACARRDDESRDDESSRVLLRRAERGRIGRIESRFRSPLSRRAAKPPARVRTAHLRVARTLPREGGPSRSDHVRARSAPLAERSSQVSGSRPPAKADVKSRRPRCVPPSRSMRPRRLLPATPASGSRPRRPRAPQRRGRRDRCDLERMRLFNRSVCPV